jgi:hypothetical protein
LVCSLRTIEQAASLFRLISIRVRTGYHPVLLSLCSFSDFAALNTPGAHAHPFRATRGKLYPDWLQVRVEPAPSPIIRVRYVIAELRPFAANLTFFCHDK